MHDVISCHCDCRQKILVLSIKTTTTALLVSKEC